MASLGHKISKSTKKYWKRTFNMRDVMKGKHSFNPLSYFTGFRRSFINVRNFLKSSPSSANSAFVQRSNLGNTGFTRWR